MVENFFEGAPERILTAIGDFIRPDLERIRRIEYPKADQAYLDYLLGAGPKPAANHYDVDERIRSLCTSYIEFMPSFTSLESMPMYFKRTPTKSLGVSPSDHLRNMIELYFEKTYVFHERLNCFLGTIEEIARTTKIDSSAETKTKMVRKACGEAFSSVRRARGTHVHNYRYEDHLINRLSTLELLTRAGGMRELDWHYKNALKQARAEWAKKARNTHSLAKLIADAACALAEPQLQHLFAMQRAKEDR